MLSSGWEGFTIAYSSIMSLISIGLAVLMVVSRWMIYEKAGEPGWGAVVPFYSSYCIFKISGHKNLFWGWLAAYIVMLISCVCFYIWLFVTLISAIGTAFSGDTATFGGIMVALIVFILLLMISSVAVIVFNALMCSGLAKNFGESGGFAVGLFFLPWIFLPILAFSKDRHYIGPGSQYGSGPQNGYQAQYNTMQNGYHPQYSNPQSGYQAQYNNPQNGYQVQYNNPQNGYQTQYSNSQSGNQAQYNNPQNGYYQPYNAPQNGYGQPVGNGQPYPSQQDQGSLQNAAEQPDPSGKDIDS